MKKAVFAAFIAGVLVLAGFGAQAIAAGPTWPSKCANPNSSILNGFKCVDAHMNALHKQNVSLSNRVKDLETLTNCLLVDYITQYGTTDSFGYMWDDNGDKAVDFDVSAIDFTPLDQNGNPTDTVSDYIVVLDPQCLAANGARLPMHGHHAAVGRHAVR